eukprot:184569-Rhodomonas_salina.2
MPLSPSLSLSLSLSLSPSLAVSVRTHLACCHVAEPERDFNSAPLAEGGVGGDREGETGREKRGADAMEEEAQCATRVLRRVRERAARVCTQRGLRVHCAVLREGWLCRSEIALAMP